MEVFNQSVQTGSMPGAMPGGTSPGESGPLDRTASGSGNTGGLNDPQNTGTGQQAGSGAMPAGGSMEGMETAGMGGTQESAGGADETGQMGSGGETGNGSLGSDGSQSGNMGGTGQVFGSDGTAQQSGQAGSGNQGQQGPGGIFGGSGNQGSGSGNVDLSGRRVIVIGSGPGVMTEEERVGNYDKELEEQMRVFDGIILGRRQETVARSNEEGAGDIASATGDVYGTESGFDSAPLLTTASVDPNNNQTSGQLPDAPSDNRQGDYQNQSDPNKNIPPDISDGSDDDIVARQLREAAIAEQDPVLREKLWDEYRKYKEGVQARR